MSTAAKLLRIVGFLGERTVADNESFNLINFLRKRCRLIVELNEQITGSSIKSTKR